MFAHPPRLTKPGLFITATDTGVGKTLVACGIAQNLRRVAARARVGVCKPFATGCRRDREGLVSEDAEALAHFADCRQPLDVINPIRYIAPVAPAVAAELTGNPPDLDLLARCLETLDQSSDFLLVEGIGGLLVPLARRVAPEALQSTRKASTAATPPPSSLPSTSKPPTPILPHYDTVLDLALALGYPVVVVTRANLGTLSHTAMTVEILRRAGCPIAGLVVNGFVTDSSPSPVSVDISMTTNRPWLEKLTGLPILAVVPACPPAQVAPAQARIPDAILDALALTYWADVADVKRPQNQR